MPTRYLFVILALAAAPAALAQPAFTEVALVDTLLVTPEETDFWITSVAPADADADGDLDLLVLGYYVIYGESAEDVLVLYRNDG
ncbi:MAG: hypothetical protein R3362_12750, partial [Rhodothermales bacterium]|nr:hypothetical protein [Rhodothermales bacterium]